MSLPSSITGDTAAIGAFLGMRDEFVLCGARGLAVGITELVLMLVSDDFLAGSGVDGPPCLKGVTGARFFEFLLLFACRFALIWLVDEIGVIGLLCISGVDFIGCTLTGIDFVSEEIDEDIGELKGKLSFSS